MEIFLNKMPVRLVDNRVEYFMMDVDKPILVNEWIGKQVSIEFTQELKCLDCQKIVKKFYSQGLCYLCMMSSPLNSDCIIRPELCEAHLGKGKVPEWEEKHHNQPHIVYLANSGGLKVGVTRVDQIPTRWIDQGADEAIILAHVPYRQLAGQIEVALKPYLSDKTNWRTMLKNQKDTSINLLSNKMRYAEMLDTMGGGMSDHISEDDTVYMLNYPSTVIENPINSLKLEKELKIEGILTGIKAQYLIFDEKRVLNVRNQAGYGVKISF